MHSPPCISVYRRPNVNGENTKKILKNFCNAKKSFAYFIFVNILMYKKKKTKKIRKNVT